MEQVNKEAYGQIRKWTRYTNQFHFLLLLRKHMEDKTMCEAGYDLKLLLKNEENIITETKWGKSEADRCPYAWEKLYIPYFHKVVLKEVDFSKAAKRGYVENGKRGRYSGDQS